MAGQHPRAGELCRALRNPRIRRSVSFRSRFFRRKEGTAHFLRAESRWQQHPFEVDRPTGYAAHGTRRDPESVAGQSLEPPQDRRDPEDQLPRLALQSAPSRTAIQAPPKTNRNRTGRALRISILISTGVSTSKPCPPQSFHNHRITTRVSFEIVRSIFLARALRFR